MFASRRTFAWLVVSALLAIVLSSCSSTPVGPPVVPGGINGELRCNTEAGWEESRIDIDSHDNIGRTTLEASVTTMVEAGYQRSILLRVDGNESTVVPTILRMSRPGAADAGVYVGSITGKTDQGYATSQDIVYQTDRYVPVVDGMPQGQLNGFTFCIW